MHQNQENDTRLRPRFGQVAELLAWVAAAGIACLWVDPASRYLASAPVFRFGWDPFAGRLAQPGGLAEWLGAWLAQLDHDPWLGALVFALLTGGVCAATRRLMQGCAEILAPAALAPGVLLLIVYGRYQLPAHSMVCAVLFSLAALLACRRLTRLKPWAHLAVWFVPGLLVLQIGGAGPALLFLVAATLDAFTSRRDRWPAAAGLTALAVSLLAVFAAQMRHPNDLIHGTAAAIVIRTLLYAGLPLLLGLAWWSARHRADRPSPVTLRPRKSHVRAKDHRGTAWSLRRWHMETGLAGLAVAAFLLGIDRQQRTLARIQSEAEGGNWPGVLRVASYLRDLPLPARLQVNRALFQTGRLTSDLFTFPQRNGVDLLPSLSDGLDFCLPLCDTLLELGQINLAEHYAHEAVELRGERPEFLWRLARINLVKDRPRAARVYLNVLARVPFHRVAARQWLLALDQDPSGATVGDVARLRSRRTTVDWVERHFGTAELLRQSIQSNPRNRMAVEYLMTHFLLARQPEEVVRNLAALGTNASATLPRHLSEAVLALGRSSGSKNSLPIAQLDPATVERYGRFLAALQRSAGRNGAGADPAFAASFGDTYWFYNLAGWNPGRTGSAGSGD